MHPRSAGLIFTTLFTAAVAVAAPADRVTGPVDARRVRVAPGNLHRLASPQFDQGAVDPAMPMSYILLMTKPSTAQQTELDRLLADQQNPSSPQFHKWLTPEEFGARFGLSPSDHSKVAAWLQSEGFTIKNLARGRNWIAFSGTAGQVSKALHTSIHRFQVDGEKHYANSTEPSVPEALADVVSGFVGLNDFRLKPMVRLAPADTSGSSHFIAPQDFATIYDIAPLYQAGINGAGTSIAVVGASDYLLSDLTAFQKRYGLPANAPKLVPYDPFDDPGINGALMEVDLDLEWASAIAPGATIYYVYGVDPFEAIITAVNLDTAPIITSSYAGCEIDYSPNYYRAVAQQANAQGITILNASGDSGAAGCDIAEPAFATQGLAVTVPGAMPEVTAVGGTQLVEGTGSYWATSNSANLGSALAYIPEAAWNESNAAGISAGTGGSSIFYPRPAWQTGPGVPNDTARHVPDIAFAAAANHDGYLITYFGQSAVVGGTSAGTPSMAGIVALLNQYLVSNGVQAKPGLGNINPQLYRLAQSTPAVFHDVLSGSNIVPCAQGSPECLAGSFGFNAGPGYDMATGLGSIDVNALATNWNSATSGVTVTLSASPAKVTANDTIQLTATVTSASATGTPTGTVSFSLGTLAIGSATLGADGAAGLTFPAYSLGGTGTGMIFAQYSGDAAFSSGGASAKIQVTTPSGAASIIPSAPDIVWPGPPDAQGLSWQTSVTLQEIAGVAAMLTGFSVDGQAQPLAQYFPQTGILPRGSITSSFVLRNLVTPLTHTLGFSGVDAKGQSWSVQVSVFYNGLTPTSGVGFIATPLTVTQNVSADPSCQWPVQLHLDDVGGDSTLIDYLYAGSSDVSSQMVPIFGTARLEAYGSLAGTLCFGGITPPAIDTIQYILDDGSTGEMTVSFAGPPPNPIQISASPANIPLAASAGQPAQAALYIGLSDPAQQWTASVFPANRTTGWLSLSQLSGTGPSQMILTANGAEFEPGAYRATIVLQSANAIPQTLTVPVMMVFGGSTSGTAITGVANSAASGLTTGAAGMLLTVTGTQLANASATVPARTNPFPYTLGGVSAYVNGLAAPLVSVSPGQLVLQIPYEAGSGPAVVGIDNNGQVAGFQFQIAPSAPGIYDDGKGNLSPSSTAKQGATATVQINGAGDIPPSVFGDELSTAYLPTTTYRPTLPISVTVGGVPAFLQTTAQSTTVLGETQLTFIVPSTVPPGAQPVVVTVGGVSSQTVNLTVQ